MDEHLGVTRYEDGLFKLTYTDSDGIVMAIVFGEEEMRKIISDAREAFSAGLKGGTEP